MNKISSVVATICKMRNYPMIHVPLGESLGKKRQTTMIGYRVPINIPGAYHGFRTFYVSDIRESKLSLLSATQFLEEGWRLRYSEHGISFKPPSIRPQKRWSIGYGVYQDISDSETIAAVTMHPRIDLLKLLAKSDIRLDAYRLTKELGLTFRDSYHHLKALEELGLMAGRFRYHITERGREILSIIESSSELRE